MRFFPFTNTSHLPSSFVFPNSHVGSRVNEENGSLGSAPLRPPPASGLPRPSKTTGQCLCPIHLPSSLLRRDSQIAGLCPVGNSLGALQLPCPHPLEVTSRTRPRKVPVKLRPQLSPGKGHLSACCPSSVVTVRAWLPARWSWKASHNTHHSEWKLSVCFNVLPT